MRIVYLLVIGLIALQSSQMTVRDSYFENTTTIPQVPGFDSYEVGYEPVFISNYDENQEMIVVPKVIINLPKHDRSFMTVELMSLLSDDMFNARNYARL